MDGSISSVESLFDIALLLSGNRSRSGIVNQNDSSTLILLGNSIRGLPQSPFKFTFEKYSRHAEKHILSTNNGRSRRVLDVPNILSGNHSVFTMASLVMKDLKKFSSRKTQFDPEKFTKSAEFSNLVRNLNNSNSKRSTGDVFSTESSRKSFIECQRIHFILDEERSKSIAFLSQYKYGKDEGDKEEKLSLYIKNYLDVVENRDIAVVILGPAMAVKIGKSWFLTTGQHYKALIQLFKTYSHLSLLSSCYELSVEADALILALHEGARLIADKDPEFVGESIKATRQLFMYDLDSNPIMSNNPKKDYISTLTSERSTNALEFYNIVANLSKNKTVRINICNTYKAFVHPDANLEEVFRTITGVQDPNVADSELIPRFKATARRALYSSLRSSGHDVRLSGDNELAAASQLTRVDLNKIVGFSFVQWSNVKFEKCPSIPEAESLNVEASDKSSCKGGPGDINDFHNMKDWSQSSDKTKPKCKDKYGNMNDLKSEMDGESELHGKIAISKFKRLIKVHKDFESKYPQLNIEQIPLADLQSFLESTEEARTLVSTEPKYGEYHKKLTRMFYIAEQFIKGVTQRVERLARLVSRKQMGVSIVKGYEAMRKDLENFCNAMTGPDSDNRAVFISFDLSEFSKKFPMAILRAYGEILAELTGEEWLSRIDLVFRSAIVIHNTRGYFDFLIGVLGGFEGFFNFVWSSCHAVIMEIALESIALSGQLLAFSDDGLFYFLVRRNVPIDKIRSYIYKIQKIYARFGLTFNLKKTFISFIIWEYLGNVCYDSRLLDMSLKESSVLGQNMRSDGIQLVSDAIIRIVGQSRSLIKSGASPNKSYFLMHYYSQVRLTRIDNSLTESTMEAILITPLSSSGFRIPSLIEMMSSTNIDSDSEFLADLVLYSSKNPLVTQTSVTFVMRHFSGKENSVRSLILGTRFKTKGFNTSGSRVCNKMIDLVIEETSISAQPNPLTDKLINELKVLISCYKNLDPDYLRRFIESLKIWVDYTKSLSMVKSKAGAKLLKRSVIKRMQAEEIKNVSDALTAWRKLEVNTVLTPKTLLDYANNVFLFGLAIKEMKPSFRLAYSRSSSESGKGIMVSLGLDNNKTISGQSYREPAVNFSYRSTSSGWMSESNSITEISNVRKMLDTISSVISHDPEYLQFYRSMANIFGFTLPDVPAGLLTNVVRRNFDNSVDVSTFYPKFFMALSSSRYVNGLQQHVYSLPSADRRTYLDLSRVAASIEFDSVYLPNYKGGCKIQNFFYRLLVREDGIDDIFLNPQIEPIKVYTPINKNVRDAIDETMRTEFVASTMEHMEARRMANILDNQSFKKVDEGSREATIVREMRRNKLIAFVTSVARGQSSCIAPTSSIAITLLERGSDIRRAIIIGAYQSLDPTLKKRVASWFMGQHYSKVTDNNRYEINNESEDKNKNKSKDKKNNEDEEETSDSVRDEKDTSDNESESGNECDTEGNQLETGVKTYSEHKSRTDPKSKLWADYDSTSSEGSVDQFDDPSSDLTDEYWEGPEIHDATFEYDFPGDPIPGEFPSLVKHLANSISLSNPDFFTKDMMVPILDFSEYEYKPLTDFILSRNLMSLSKLQVIRSQSSKSHGASKEIITLFNDVYTNTITSMYTVCNLVKWDKSQIKKLFPSVDNADELIDYLSVQRGYLRPSRHRTQDRPVNRTTEVISMLKFYAIIRREVFLLNTSHSQGKETSKKDIKYDINEEYMIRITGRGLGFDEQDLGPDHRTLITEPISYTVRSRICSVAFHYHQMYIKNNEKSEGFSNPDTYRERSIDEIKRDSSAFYANYISPFTKRIVEIPSNLFELLANTSSTESISIDNIRQSDSVYGKLVNLEDLDERIESLIGLYLESYCISNEMPGMNSDNIVIASELCRMQISHPVEMLSCPTLLVDDASIKAKNRSLLLIECETLEAVVHTIIYLKDMNDCEPLIFSSNNLFYVMSIVNAGMYKIERDTFVSMQPPNRIITLLADYSIEPVSMRVKISSRKYLSLSADLSVRSAKIADSFLRTITHSNNEVTKSPSLLAAKEVIMARRNNAEVVVYVLVISYLRRMETTDGRTKIYEEVRQFFRDNKEGSPARTGITYDIAQVYSWLRQSNFSADISLTALSANAIVSEFIILGENIKFPIKEIFIFSSATPLSRMLVGNDYEIGSIGDIVYRPQLFLADAGDEQW